ncbi:MAG: ATP-binding cassette domain-containing protein [Gammaproteobacteria bacterium]|nr:ATP-binding cassette domain-containing protein [Gammaproteobacteria bacterium]
MFRSLTNRVLRLFARNMSISTERILWLTLEPISRFKFGVCSVFSLGVLSGLLEGLSVGLIALSVVVITGENEQCSAQISGVVDFLGLDLCVDFDKESMFILLLLLGASGQVIKACVQYLTQVVNAYLQSKVVFYLQTRVMEHIMSLHYQSISQFSAGDKQSLLGHAAAPSVVLTAINSIIVTSCTFLGYFVLLVGMSWQLSVFSSVILIVMSIAILPLLRRLGRVGKEVTKNGVKLAKTSIDYLLAIKLIKLYGNDRMVLSTIKDILWRGNKLKRDGAIIVGLLAPLQETVILFIGVGVLLVGHYQILASISQPLPTLLGYVMVLYRCGGRFAELNIIRAQLAKVAPMLGYVAEFLRVDDKRFQRTTGIEIPNDWKAITLDKVCFRYSEKSEGVINDVSLTISRGEKLAIVGRSGSGKSTLIDLIAGLNDPSEGEVSIHEVPSGKALPASWFSCFSVVSQSDLIFNASVRENLLFANPNASEEQIIAACKIAYAHEFISEMADGYDSPLGERGLKISGGQIQRIALARAILKNSSVLILDEATSALDVLSEKNIIKAVYGLDRVRTVLMIAHRLSTVVNADRIIVLDRGQIVDQGVHADLKDRPGLYKEMWDTQSSNEWSG